MKELQIRKDNLPANIEDLQKFILVGKEVLKAYMTKLGTIDKLSLAYSVKKQTLEDTQIVSTALLWAEARLGDILLTIDKSKSYTGFSKRNSVLPKGINKKQRHIAQNLSKNKNLIEEIVKEAKELEEIPTRREILKRIEQKRRIDRNSKLTKPIMPKGKFDIIYADPPWEYKHSQTKSRDIEKNYPTMELEEIKNLEIPSFEDSVLLLWATAPKLEEALIVMNAWGFNYRTCAVWDKEIIGMGYWFRGQHELLLVGVKGNFSPPKQEDRVSSVFKQKRGHHSSKPAYFYDLIEKMFPEGKYLELFSKGKYNNKWRIYGNQL